MPFWTKEREAEIWDFKGKAGDIQVDKKEETCGKQILTGPPRNIVHNRKFSKQAC